MPTIPAPAAAPAKPVDQAAADDSAAQGALADATARAAQARSALHASLVAGGYTRGSVYVGECAVYWHESGQVQARVIKPRA